jgi:hypothetical protein
VIFQAPKGLSAADLREDTVSGAALRGAATAALASLGRPASALLELADLADPVQAFTRLPYTGDGVIHAGVAASGEGAPELVATIGDIIAALGAVQDRAGRDGVNAEKVTAFFQAAREIVA